MKLIKYEIDPIVEQQAINTHLTRNTKAAAFRLGIHGEISITYRLTHRYNKQKASKESNRTFYRRLRHQKSSLRKAS
jgi:hypothetical protein